MTLATLVLVHALDVGVQGRGADGQGGAVGMRLLGDVLDLLVDAVDVDVLGVDKAEILAVDVGGGIAAQGFRFQDVADGGHQAALLAGVHGRGHRVEVVDLDQGHLRLAARTQVGLHALGRRFAERSLIEQSALAMAAQVLLAGDPGVNGIDLQGEEEMVGEIGDAVAGDGDHRRAAADSVEAHRDVVDAPAALGLGQEVDERRPDQGVGGLAEQRRRGAGGEGDVALVAEFEQDIGPAESQGDEAVAFLASRCAGGAVTAGRLGGGFCHRARRSRGPLACAVFGRGEMIAAIDTICTRYSPPPGGWPGPGKFPASGRRQVPGWPGNTPGSMIRRTGLSTAPRPIEKPLRRTDDGIAFHMVIRRRLRGRRPAPACRRACPA